MLQFVNKEGKKVMELHDNGDVKVLNEKLKASFSEVSPSKKEKGEDENE